MIEPVAQSAAVPDGNASRKIPAPRPNPRRDDEEQRGSRRDDEERRGTRRDDERPVDGTRYSVIPAGGRVGGGDLNPDDARSRRASVIGAKAAALPASLPVRRGIQPAPATTGWTLETFAGRMTEFSADRSGGALTLALGLLREAQLSGEPTAWIARPEGSFYPPDAVVAGVDLAALPVIEPRRPVDAFKAADRLLRSGAFGLIAVDFSPGVTMPIAAQTRLAGLAKKHGTALICLTEKEATEPSLGSLVSLRAQISRLQLPSVGAGVHPPPSPGGAQACPERSRRGPSPTIVAGRARDLRLTYGVRARVIKDKQRGPGWEHAESFSGPPGLV